MLISFGGNTVFNGSLDYNVVEDFVVPPIAVLDCIPNPPLMECNDNDGSIGSKLNENLSEFITVNENIKQYLTKGGTCGIRSCNSKTFDIGKDF